MRSDIASGHNLSASYYYRSPFISPQGLYAEIEEEMKSYFNTGVIDDTMFAIYTEKALKKLGRATYKIDEVVLDVSGYQAVLPEDFSFVRQLWTCQVVERYATVPRSVYEQKTLIILPDANSPCDPDLPAADACNSFQVVEKTTGAVVSQFAAAHKLWPATRRAGALCAGSSNNDNDANGYDIDGCKLHVGFECGQLYLIYYKQERDAEQHQLVPDNYAICEYIKSFIKFKLYEQLYNEITDETFNQVERKYQNYRQEYLDAFIIADAEIKKQTVADKFRSIKRARRAMYPFIIP